MSRRILLLLLIAIVLAFVLWLPDSGQRERMLVDGPVRIGVIALTEVDQETLAGFKAGMADYGYEEGDNLVFINQGPAITVDRLEPMIEYVLAQGVDLIYVSSTPATLKVKELTASRPLPVIFSPVNDPVGAGIVPSLREPGGMITGIKLPPGDTLRLRWLRDFAPQARRIYFPYNPIDKSALETLRQVEEVAPVLGMELVKAPMASPEEIRTALATVPTDIDAIFLPRDSSIEAQIALFVDLCYQRQIPLSAPSLTQVRQGALYTYGFVHFEFGRQSARLADQIIRGMSPAHIPVELAESYLAINLETAQTIDLRFSPELMQRADFIIRGDSGTEH